MISSSAPTPLSPLPLLVVHCDWSTNPKKRWMARAFLGKDSDYQAFPPERVGDLANLLLQLATDAGPGGRLLVGFDFPIGLPDGYASRAGVDDFLTLLPNLGQGEWADFYTVAELPAQISLRRPFYPAKPGSSRHSHLLAGLQVESIDDLRRRCERGQLGRRAAAPLFWTLGGQQVGKASICGWREVLAPALAGQGIEGRDALFSSNLSIWPFSGRISDLLQTSRVIVAETYPAEFYRHLGIEFSPSRQGRKSGKRTQTDRAANAECLLQWAEKTRLALDPSLQATILEGFGPSQAGEDPFDATIGLFGMLNVVLGYRPPGEPQGERIRRVEGWILGCSWG